MAPPERDFQDAGQDCERVAQWALSRNAARPSASVRRPLEDREVPLLAALGSELRALRQQAQLTQAVPAWRAQIGERSLRRIEAGHRRTRTSTLRRLLFGFGLPDADECLTRLLLLAGQVVAPESEHAERIDERRQRRHRKAVRRFVTEHTIVYMDHADGRVAVHRHLRRVSRTGTAERTYAVLHLPDGRRHRFRGDPVAELAAADRRGAATQSAGTVAGRDKDPQAAWRATRHKRPLQDLPGRRRRTTRR